jgi:hypothetical protein
MMRHQHDILVLPRVSKGMGLVANFLTGAYRARNLLLFLIVRGVVGFRGGFISLVSMQTDRSGGSTRWTWAEIGGGRGCPSDSSSRGAAFQDSGWFLPDEISDWNVGPGYF